MTVQSSEIGSVETGGGTQASPVCPLEELELDEELDELEEDASVPLEMPAHEHAL